uniref:Uncharacterized protein n=1 Tax=Cacopsylla melanoneura TaxID=428564 RepID=A0A8D8LJY3_9HEMI
MFALVSTSLSTMLFGLFAIVCYLDCLLWYLTMLFRMIAIISTMLYWMVCFVVECCSSISSHHYHIFCISQLILNLIFVHIFFESFLHLAECRRLLNLLFSRV